VITDSLLFGRVTRVCSGVLLSVCYIFHSKVLVCLIQQMARERAEKRFAVLELEVEASSSDLKLEKLRLQGVRERIVLRYMPLNLYLSMFMIILFFIFTRGSTKNP
jgi:hypothetical protein